MRRPAAMLAAWGAWIGAWAGTLAIWGEALVPAVMFGAAAGATALWAGYLVVLPRPTDPPRRLPDGSPAPPLIAVGMLLAANGLAFGLWLVLIGAEVMAFGLGLLLAEWRASRAR